LGANLKDRDTLSLMMSTDSHERHGVGIAEIALPFAIALASKSLGGLSETTARLGFSAVLAGLSKIRHR